jgi:hypothetical protein
VTYAATELLFGYGAHEVFILGLVTGLLTLAAVYYAVLHASGRVPALWAAAFWAVIGGTYCLGANQPKVEPFLNSSLVWAVALLMRLKSDSFDWKRSLGVGAMIVLASFYKHSTVLVAFWLALAHLAASWHEPARRRIAFRQIELFMRMGLLAWTALFSYYAIRGYRGEFFDALITYNQYFSGGPIEGIKRLGPQDWFPFFFRWAMPVAIPIIMVCAVGIKRGPPGNGSYSAGICLECRCPFPSTATYCLTTVNSGCRSWQSGLEWLWVRFPR